jgi:8-amino-7-oxononanoate synthase
VSSLDRFAIAKLQQLENAGLRRVTVETDRTDGLWVLRNGRRLLSFSCNDYLNLSQHPTVKAAAADAAQRYGAGAGASRLVTGNHPLFGILEGRLARIKGTEAACVFGSGYLANLGIIPTLAAPEDLILVDELAHACIMAGAKLSGARTLPFRHNDIGHLDSLLTEHRDQYRHAIIATDGVFSMDGDLAPLSALGRVAARWDSWLLSDDAHGIGVIGGGRGSSFASGTPAAVPLQMGTLSKALGSYGGYLCGSHAVIDLMKTRARTLIYSTGLPPASAAAAIAALDLIESDPSYAALPVAKARLFSRLLGVKEAESPIVPVMLGDAKAALGASRLLEDEGFLVVAIRPPTVPAGTARLRVAFTALHPDAEIERLAQVIRSRIAPTTAAA